MRAENHHFVGFLAPADFAHHVFLLERPANLVGHREPHADSLPNCGAGRNEARQAQGVFPRHDCLGNLVEFAQERIGVPVEQHAFARRHPQNRCGARLHRTADNLRRTHVLVEQVGPGHADVAVHQKNRTFRARTCSGKFICAPAAHVHQVRFDSSRRSRRRPPFSHEMYRERHRCEDFEPRLAFAPRHRHGVLLRVYVYACSAKRRHAPLDRALHRRTPGDAPANFIGQAAQIALKRGRPHHDGQNLCSGLLARRWLCCRAACRALRGLERAWLRLRKLRRCRDQSRQNAEECRTNQRRNPAHESDSFVQKIRQFHLAAGYPRDYISAPSSHAFGARRGSRTQSATRATCTISATS